MSSTFETILVLDFGSQYTQLIGRRIREANVYSEILPFSTPLETIERHKPKGIILSGGPDSVYEKGAPAVDPPVVQAGYSGSRCVLRHAVDGQGTRWHALSRRASGSTAFVRSTR